MDRLSHFFFLLSNNFPLFVFENNVFYFRRTVLPQLFTINKKILRQQNKFRLFLMLNFFWQYKISLAIGNIKFHYFLNIRHFYNILPFFVLQIELIIIMPRKDRVRKERDRERKTTSSNVPGKQKPKNE